MIPATQRKLREAQFFYRRLVSARQEPWKHETEAFSFYFSAFLSAARSVPWVLQNEQKEEYEAWKPRWEDKLTTDERKLLKLTTDLRNAEVKRAGAGTVVEMEEVVIQVLNPSGISGTPLGTPVTLTGAFPSSSAAAKVGRWIHYVEDEGGRKEVTALCKRYLEYFEKLVEDFVAAHG